VNLDELPIEPWQRDRVREVFQSPFYEWLGLKLETVGGGTSQVRFLPREELLVAGKTLDGSVMNAVLEVPSFLALLCELQDGEIAITNDIFVQQLRAVSGGSEILLEGRLIRRGRTMAWTEAQASVDGKICALARITKTLLSSS
jgi:acyl-coenzyme A thioesterase PaaI-like protein